jgi:hypothetical protein
MDVDDEIGKLTLWVFVEHNRAFCTVRDGLRNLSVECMREYFFENWREYILPRIDLLEQDIVKSTSKFKSAQGFSKKKKIIREMRSLFENERDWLRDHVSVMSVYSWDQDMLGPIT